MKKFLKIFGIIIVVFFIFLDIAFCVLPSYLIKLETYKSDLQRIVKEQSKLNLEYDNAKIITTPLFAAGININNIKVTMPDGSTLFSAENVKTRISLPSLILFTVKVSCAEIDKPFVNLEIMNNSNFKISKLIEDILNEQRQKELENPKQHTQTEEEAAFDLSKIRIVVPNVNLNDYKILINDLQSKHYLDLKGDKLTFGYFNGKTAKIKTFAQLHSDENVNINANIDISSFIPKIEPSLDEEDDPAQKVEIPFVNPVTMYRNYDLRANLYSKLKIISDKNDKIKSYGYIDVEDLTMKIGDISLPKSYFKAKAFGKNVWLDTNLNITEKQSINLGGKINYGENPDANLNIKTDKIHFNDLLVLTRAFLDSLHIRHELNTISTSGFFEADANIKTNFKKLTSNGFINVENGALQIRDIGRVISDANINILLNDDKLNINNSKLLLNGSKIKISGQINNDSQTDIAIDTEKIPLKGLFYAFAPKEVRNAINFSSGNLIFNLNIKGELKKAITHANFTLSNLQISDIKNSYIITNEVFNGFFNTDSQNILAHLINKNFVVNLPKNKSKILADKFEVNIDNDVIDIKENKLLFNNSSKIVYSGVISNYKKLQNIDFNAAGNINTQDIVTFVGKELIPYIHSSGSLPLKVTLSGNAKKQTLFARVSADSSNYITPIDLADISGQNSAIQTVIDFKPNRIKIKNTGFFKRVVLTDSQGIQNEKLNDIVSLDGTIAGDTINLLKINIPNDLKAKMYTFPKSNFVLNKTKLYIFGKTKSPRYLGDMNIANINIPELFTTLGSVHLQLRGQRAVFNLNNLNLNGSILNIQGAFNLFAQNIFKIFDLKINSNFIDVDKVMKVADNAMKYTAQSGTSSSGSASSDVPVAVYNGNINISHLKTGDINVYYILSNLFLVRNVIFLQNLKASVFDGYVNGNISMNLLNSLLKINMSGNGINVEKALADAAKMKGALSGKASFKANLSLRGSTYNEQIKSLKGDLNFTVNDGQFGPFGRIENMILAENIRESDFFKTALGGIIDSLTKIDTTHFNELKGDVRFEDGICKIEELTSSGKILALHIFGDYDILKNYADMKVRAKMTSVITNLLGPIALINPIKLLNSAASLNVVTAKAFSIFCETLTKEEAETIPNFSNKYLDESAMKFQLVVRGDAAKPLKLVKSFKWLATPIEFKKADDFIASIPEQQEGSTATTIEEVIKENELLEAEKQTKMYKIKHIFKKEHEKKQEKEPETKEEAEI